MVARGFQSEEVALWHSTDEGATYQRLFGLTPPALLDAEALRGWQAMEKLGKRLFEAMLSFTHKRTETGARPTHATEYGGGRDHALVVDFSDRAVVYARPTLATIFPSFFKSGPTRCFEVFSEGKVMSCKGDEDQDTTQCNSRYSVTISGDRIRFAQPNGEEGEMLVLPWVSPEDRAELRKRFGAMVDQETSPRPRAVDVIALGDPEPSAE